MMDGFHEPDGWRDQEVYIEGLGALLFSLGEKWRKRSRPSRFWTVHMMPLSVLAFLLLSSSALLHPFARSSPSALQDQPVVCDALQVNPTNGARPTWTFTSRPGEKTLTVCGLILDSRIKPTPQSQHHQR